MHQSGHDVLLIARGAHHDAIAANGLRFETPVEGATLRIPVARDPAEGRVGDGDVVLLCTKGQDTWAALRALRDVAPRGVPVVCVQNGVENERIAARLVDDVLAGLVMIPSQHLEPGVVLSLGANLSGSLDIGVYPSGSSELCEQICGALSASRFESTPRPDIMRFKHAKLINNLANSVQAVCGIDDEAEELTLRVRSEGRAVLEAAGIACDVADVANAAGRFRRYGVTTVPGHVRGGGSTWQSVTRGTGAVETDFLNGEIVMRGRLLGLPTPVNRLMQQLVLEMVRDGHAPGWLSAQEVLARLETA
jgi:2-dehydropantoate 2-reductase